MSGQCFQVRGGIVEHVRTFEVDHVIERSDRGWTAGDLAGELPRMFGAGAHRADPPPKEWQDAYHAKGGPSTAPHPLDASLTLKYGVERRRSGVTTP